MTLTVHLPPSSRPRISTFQGGRAASPYLIVFSMMGWMISFGTRTSRIPCGTSM